MMHFREKEENSLNIFIFISLVLHAVLFLTFPQWNSLLVSTTPGVEQGGVFRVFLSDSGPAREWSPVSDPTSQTTTPQVNKPKPTSEPPISTANAIPIEPEPVDNIVPPVKPRPKPENTIQQEQPVVEIIEPDSPSIDDVKPQQAAVIEPEIEPEPVISELVTSESGREVFIEPTEQPEVIPETEQTLESVSIPEKGAQTQQEADIEETGPSGTGEHPIGAYSSGTGSVVESGQGEAETALKPPQLPGGRGLFSRPGGLGYPKDAQHDRAEGVVELDLFVDSKGNTIDAVIINPSLDPRLDEFSRQVVKKIGLADNVKDKIQSTGQDIIITVKIHFSIEDGNYESYIDDEIDVRLAEE